MRGDPTIGAAAGSRSPRAAAAPGGRLGRLRRGAIPALPLDALRSAAARVGGRTASALVPVAAGLAAAIPVIESTAAAVRAGWMPAGDDGIIATRGWDVLSAHTPLVGQYSEAGMVLRGQILHSPGPMLYWLIALHARFGSVASIAVTMCVANVLAIICCVVLARRRGGAVLMFATAIAIALMCRSLPTESMHDIWNPAAALLPFLALVFLGWSLACGEHRLAPLVVLVASFVVQTHLMYALPSAVVLTVACGGLALACLRRRRGGERTRAARVWPWALASLAVAAACWAPPAIDQIDNSPGNLAAIVRTAEHRGPTLGATVGWHALVRSVGIRPWWVYAPASEWERKADVLARPGAGAERSAIAILAALALVALVAAWARRGALLAAALMALGLCGAIVVQAAGNPAPQLLAETLGYTLWWGSELGLWVWLVLAWALWLSLRAAAGRLPRSGGRVSDTIGGWWRRRRVRLPALAGVVAAAIAATGVVGRDSAASGRADSHVYEYRPIAAAAAGIERAIPAGRTIGYELGPLDLGTQPMEPALRFLLVRHGDRVLADGSFPRLGSYYQLDHRPVQWVLYLTDRTRPQAGMQLSARVAFTGPWGRETLSAWTRRVAPGAPRVAAHR